MILVDTSVWIDHLRSNNASLSDLLERELVLVHPFVVGEIALGGASASVILHLQKLPELIVATDEETLAFIHRYRIAGRGIGYVDAHLLVSVRLTSDARLWTLDKSLRSITDEMKLSAELGHSTFQEISHPFVTRQDKNAL